MTYGYYAKAKGWVDASLESMMVNYDCDMVVDFRTFNMWMIPGTWEA